MKRYRVIFLPLAAIVLAIGYGALRSSNRDRLSGWFAPDVEIPVKVLRVKKVQLTRVIDIVAELQPLNETEIVSQLPGIVKEIRYKSGDTVKAGAVVATIQSKELMGRLRANEAAVKEAEEALREKEKQLVGAERALATARELHGKELIARRDVDEAAAAANTAGAEKEVAQAQLAQQKSMLAQARYLLNLTRLVAPSGGVVTRRWVEPGSSVSPSMAILSIADSDTMRVAVRLTANDAALVHPGMTVRLRMAAFPGREFAGKLAQISTSSEATDKAATAEIHLPNPDGLLKPGMKAVLLLAVDETHPALLVPKESVSDFRGKNYLYTVSAGKAERKAVTKGLEQDNEVVITSGLEEGEFVIVAGLEKLRPGSRVRVLK
jgi:RND family efflux transporter MFP subunit